MRERNADRADPIKESMRKESIFRSEDVELEMMSGNKEKKECWEI